mgnify:CR=1 FL=1
MQKKLCMHLEDQQYCEFIQYVNDSMEEIYDIITKYIYKLKKHKKK